jgi:hypothetical protein
MYPTEGTVGSHSYQSSTHPMRHRPAQRRRAAHDTAEPLDPIAMSLRQTTGDDVALDAEWERLQELLSGVLGVAVDPRFQLQPRHAHASWLVLYVTRVENAQPQAKHALSKRISAVLGAVATLCAAAERLRLRETDHMAFWTRVLTSQMMARPLDSGDNAIWRFASHTRDREMRIKIQWSERKLDRALLAPLKLFLDGYWRDYDRLPAGDRTLQLRRMRIAICVTHTQLTSKDIELVGDVLSCRDEKVSPGAMPLFHDSLASLEISHTLLQAGTLRAVASRVYPRARPIDELRLEAIFPSGPLADASVVLTPEYTAAFKSVLAAALDATFCPGGPVAARPVGVSLASNSLRIVHLQALFDSLRNATRDLTSLSLKHALNNTDEPSTKHAAGVMKALEAIGFRTSNPSGRIHDECELDLTMSLFSSAQTDAFSAALADRMTRSLPLVDRALAKGERVTCRVRAERVIDNEEEHWGFRVNEDYAIVSVSDDGDIEIAGPLGVTDVVADPPRRIVGVSDIVQLTVGTKPVFQSRFTRLILDGDPYGEHRPGSLICGCSNKDLLKSLGPRLTFLSMRGFTCMHNSPLQHVIASCPSLKHLNLEGSDTYYRAATLWMPVFEVVSELETLNLNATEATMHRLSQLINALVETPELPLRRLSLAQNNLRAGSLAQIQLLLDVMPSIQQVELDSIGQADNVEAYISGRRELARDYHGVIIDSKPLSPAAKLAFLSVVRILCDGYASVEPSVLDTIFDMAQVVVTRQILWSSSK